MKFKASLLISTAFGALLLAASLVSADTKTNAEAGETNEATTEEAKPAASVDQASIAPKK